MKGDLLWEIDSTKPIAYISCHSHDIIYNSYTTYDNSIYFLTVTVHLYSGVFSMDSHGSSPDCPRMLFKVQVHIWKPEPVEG